MKWNVSVLKIVWNFFCVLRNKIFKSFKAKIIGHQFYKDVQQKNIIKVSCFSHWLDISFNILNLELQDREQNICQFCSSVGFQKKKLEIF